MTASCWCISEKRFFQYYNQRKESFFTHNYYNHHHHLLLSLSMSCRCLPLPSSNRKIKRKIQFEHFSSFIYDATTTMLQVPVPVPVQNWKLDQSNEEKFATITNDSSKSCANSWYAKEKKISFFIRFISILQILFFPFYKIELL